MAESLISSVSPTDWIRIFACRLARRRPNVCAEEVMALAIDHFKRCHVLAPEVAAERFSDAPQQAAGRPPSAAPNGIDQAD